jgi:hypothetical protein
MHQIVGAAVAPPPTHTHKKKNIRGALSLDLADWGLYQNLIRPTLGIPLRPPAQIMSIRPAEKQTSNAICIGLCACARICTAFPWGAAAPSVYPAHLVTAAALTAARRRGPLNRLRGSARRRRVGRRQAMRAARCRRHGARPALRGAERRDQHRLPLRRRRAAARREAVPGMLGRRASRQRGWNAPNE